MAIAPEVAKLMNEQINHELYSAYLYSTFVDYLEDAGLRGYANWYSVQVKEELAHAQIFRNYLLDNDVMPEMGAIAQPNKKFASVMDVLKEGLNHERYITDLIHRLYAASREHNDFRSMHFLDFFVTEQQEEEVNADDMIKDYENFSGGQGLFQLDAKYATRVYVQPAQLAKK